MEPSDLGDGGVAQDEALGGGGTVNDELDAGGQGSPLALQADDGAHPVGVVAHLVSGPQPGDGCGQVLRGGSAGR